MLLPEFTESLGRKPRWSLCTTSFKMNIQRSLQEAKTIAYKVTQMKTLLSIKAETKDSPNENYLIRITKKIKLKIHS